IDVTSGTGTTITLNDSVSATNGPAIDADGAAATITVGTAGSIQGRVDLTGNNDLITNNGLFAAAGNSDFGAGTDRITNNGTFKAAGAVALGGLETFVNAGLVTMADNTADDTLTIPGNFTAQAGSNLTLDVAAGTAGTPADRLVVGGAVSGNTQINLNLLGGPGVLNPTGTLLVDAGTSAAGAFTLGGTTSSGFVTYSLQQQGADTLLVALPTAAAIEPLLLPELGLSFWYQSADSWSENAALRRNDLLAQGRDFGVWAQAYYGDEERGDERDVDVFGTATPTDLRYDVKRTGIQAGADFAAGPNMSVGFTAGYQDADSDFASGTGVNLNGWNIGAYLLHQGGGGFYTEWLAKVDFFDGDIANGTLFTGSDFDGKSYGLEGEVGYRMTSGGANIDVNGALAYVSTDLDQFAASNGTFEFGDVESLRGRLGLRVSGNSEGLAPYADVKLLHEFLDGNGAEFVSGGFRLPLDERSDGTSVRGEVGVAGTSTGFGGFLSVWGQLGDVQGYGLRIGARF
ncbi:MAG TPA: autotransporter domain-containing protein, partial [Sphingomicrobium sp.]